MQLCKDTGFQVQGMDDEGSVYYTKGLSLRLSDNNTIWIVIWKEEKMENLI